MICLNATPIVAFFLWEDSKFCVFNHLWKCGYDSLHPTAGSGVCITSRATLLEVLKLLLSSINTKECRIVNTRMCA